MSALALQLIRKEKEERTGYLDIGRCGLTELPEELFELTWLETLVVSNRWWDAKEKKWIESKNKGRENQIDKLPSSIQKLQRLSLLRLGGDYETKWYISDISILKDLTQLQTLDLSDNSISDISILKDLTQLQTLDLSDNKQITDFSILKDLTQLQTLDLSDNSISDISILKDLTQLQTLDLSDNKQITDFSILKDLTQLQTLDLSDNKQITDFSILKDLTQLQTLDLSDNSISDISILKDLTQLQTLDLRYNKQITDFSILKDLTQLQNLYLSYNSISDISILKDLTQLQTLDLRSNSIFDISSLKDLTQLQTLDLRYNSISDISILKDLTQLQTLYLSYNKQITDFSILKDLTQLQTLDLRYNSISDISILKDLTQLQTLDLSSNKQITDFSILKDLTQLQTLDLRYNSISDISILKDLTQLQTLDLSSNKQITDFSILKDLTQLQTLDLRSNSISDIEPLLPLIKKGIPVSLKQRDFRGKINLYENPIEHPPIEVVKEGNEAIISYFEELQKQGEVPLYECKLLIIGEGGAGKTSLARKLKNEKADLPEEKESTKGIVIQAYDFTTAAGHNFRINIWDFGGQEIYHATHQFFLTKRSLYILLDDTRKDDATVNDKTFNYWLQVVELLSENSPVLIVQNEKGDRSKTLDLKSMQGRFDNILGSKATNLLTCRNFAEVRQAIEYQVQQLPHIGQKLPKRWVEIRRALEDLAQQKDYIQIEEYFDICAAHDIPEEKRALFLSSYLHDLGAFLHFQDNLVLRNLFILNNAWATDAVYKVLDDEKVKAQFGKFTESDLASIWSGRRYRYKQPQLLELMQKFQLCYPLKDTLEQSYLAPQLLPIETPEYEWEEADNLTLRYEYEFMPKGLLSRFIVRMNRYVRDIEKAWRSGVFLHRQHSDAFVRETYGNQEIVIKARGIHRKELMTLIVEDFDLMHEGYGRKLRVTKWIPCNCDKCAEREAPNFYEFEDLRRRQEKEKRTVECKISYEDVDVNGLLDGIFTEVKEEKTEQEHQQGTRTVELFLASSSELEKERREIELWIGRENKLLNQKNVFLHLTIWEDFINAMSKDGLQQEYNKMVARSDIFISLFATKVGKYTAEEFAVAYKTFLEKGHPKIYTYFKKTTDVDLFDLPDEDFNSLKAFKRRLKELKHYPTRFSNIDDLKNQLRDQLDKIL